MPVHCRLTGFTLCRLAGLGDMRLTTTRNEGVKGNTTK